MPTGVGSRPLTAATVRILPPCPGRLLALLLGSLGSTTGTQQAGSPFHIVPASGWFWGTVAPKDIQALVLGACEDQGWAVRTAGVSGWGGGCWCLGSWEAGTGCSLEPLGGAAPYLGLAQEDPCQPLTSRILRKQIHAV